MPRQVTIPYFAAKKFEMWMTLSTESGGTISYIKRFHMPKQVTIPYFAAKNLKFGKRFQLNKVQV